MFSRIFSVSRSSLSVCLLLGAASSALADPPDGYYDTVNATNSATLRTTLHAVIDDHTEFPYTSGSTDTWNILNLADEDPNNSGNILDVYKNASYPKISGGDRDYNREHTWPKSYGFPTNTPGPYTDCHMLFLCDKLYNSSRNNNPYRNCSAGCLEKTTNENNGQGGGSGQYPGNSNWRTGSGASGTWETWIGKKGDVARALFYMDLRYEGDASEPDLILTDNEDLIEVTDGPVAYMGILSVLLQWHEQDPVDDLERNRNDVVFSFQENRNPFIDNPEWVACLFLDECDGCTANEHCDDGKFCNGAETCLGGQCQDGEPVQCDDGAACTTDSCNEDSKSCEHVADDAACDDGDPCEAETCHPFVGCIAFPDDTTPPSITCPPDATIGCKESTDPDNTGEAAADDDCDPLPMVTFEDFIDDNGCDAPGSITRTWTAVDASGNDNSCDQLITILPAGCPQDLDGDGTVGPADLALLLGSWGPCEGCPTDFNGDGVVNAGDLAELLGAWGMCP